jgi:hypothetical protein
MVDFAATQVQSKGGAPSLATRGPNQGLCGQATKHATTALHMQGGGAVLPTGGDPCHRHRATGRVCPLARV